MGGGDGVAVAGVSALVEWEWEAVQLPAFTEDVMWKMVSLRVALYLLDLARLDVEAMRGAFAMERVASQLFSAVGSIRANLTEGFGRATFAVSPPVPPFTLQPSPSFY